MASAGWEQSKPLAAQLSLMEPGCGFTRGYVPTEERDLEVLMAHVRNCQDCQAESYLVLPGSVAAA